MFSANDFVDIAKSRFGEDVLRSRMRGARGDSGAADLELTRIAAGVIARVMDACVQVGWPIPGTWPTGSFDEDGTKLDGQFYADVWPRNLLQNALDLFNWRTVSGLDGVSDNQRRVGVAAETYFNKVELGASSIGVGGATDTATPAPVAARSRSGGTNLADGSQDKQNVLEAFSGFGWDRFH
jgi:hypothetical protein